MENRANDTLRHSYTVFTQARKKVKKSLYIRFVNDCRRVSKPLKMGESMREKIIEEKLTKAVKQNGGVCWKFTSPGTAGVPDRIVLMPGGRIAFVEVKAPGEKPRPIQLSRHKLLRRLGFLVYVLDACDGIEKIISEVKSDGTT